MSDEILKGYHVFGVPGSPCDYREIDVEWPLAEVNEGIFRISIHAYGDDPTDPFVEVVGVELMTTVAKWSSLAEALAGTVWLQ